MSLCFYGYYQKWWLIPLLISMGLNYVAAKLLWRTRALYARRFILICAIIQNLIPLALLKYANLIHSVLSSFAPALANRFPSISIQGEYAVIPIGLSFYTFDGMSFIIDVFHKKVAPLKNPFDFFTFMVSFPRLLSGPIMRFIPFAHQLRTYRSMDIEKGLFVFAWGFILKSFFADHYSVFANWVFDSPIPIHPLAAWLGLIAYTMQIYFDFSGYSLMALGTGYCLGFDVGLNFNRPYLAGSLREFWHRWHISLSLWLRDYVFTPLRSVCIKPLAIVLTFALSGLWHGSQWTFILWGIFHGLCLCLEGFLKPERYLPVRARQFITFFVVVIGFVLFRCHDLEHAQKFYCTLFSFTPIVDFNPSLFQIYRASSVLFLLGLFYCFVAEGKMNQLIFYNGPVGLIESIVTGAMWSASLFWNASGQIVPFLYARF